MKKSIYLPIFMIVALVLGMTSPVLCTSATDVAKQAAGQATKININKADTAQLESLPGIGPETAKGITEYRKAHGGFKSVEELKEVKGIGDKKYDAIKNMVTIE